MAAKFKADRQAMTEVLERRKPVERQKKAVTAADKTFLELMPPAPKREPKFKDLASPALTAIVDKIRPPDYDDFVAGLRKHTQAAVLHASKPAAPTPSGLSRSSYLQVKRLKLEREIGEEGKFDVSGGFLQPSGDSPTRRPKRIQPRALADDNEPPPSGWVAFS